jgi:hypothetical protein
MAAHGLGRIAVGADAKRVAVAEFQQIGDLIQRVGNPCVFHAMALRPARDQVLRPRRAAWAFWIFACRARRCAGVGFSRSGTFRLGLASNTSPFV